MILPLASDDSLGAATGVACCRPWCGLVVDVVVEHRPEMPLSENDDVIETLTSNAAEKAFACGVHERNTDCGFEDENARAFGDAVEGCAKLCVAITNNELGAFTEWRQLPQLLCSPALTRFTSHCDVHHLLRVHVDDEEREQRPRPDVVDLQEIASPDGVVGEERLPGPTITRWSHGHDVALDGALGNAKAELQQLSPNALCAPGAIVASHALDQFDGLAVEP